MTITPTTIRGCFEIDIRNLRDDRGSFFKTYNVESFSQSGLETNWQEEYFSLSAKNVLRGMHFQVPPKDHVKLVTCLSGAVLDVIVDLRKSSSTFKRCASFQLSEQNKKMLYIPKGCAHGFLSLCHNTLMFYKVSSVYSPHHDLGILWNSIDFNWSCINPIISERDRRQPSLQEFNTPFAEL